MSAPQVPDLTIWCAGVDADEATGPTYRADVGATWSQRPGVLGVVQVIAVDAGDLRGSLPYIPALSAQNLVLRYLSPGPDLPFGPLPHAVRSVDRIAHESGSRVEVVCRPAAGLRFLLAALSGPVRLDRGVRWGVAGVRGAWAAGDSGVDTAEVMSGHRHDVDGADIVLAGPSASLPAREAVVVTVTDRPTGPETLAPVDDGVVNPRLFLAEADRPPATVRLRPRPGVYWETVNPKGRTVSSDAVATGPSQRTLADLGRRPHVLVDPGKSATAEDLATAVAHLSCAGVVPRVQRRSAASDLLLGEDLVNEIEAAASVATTDPLQREAASVRLRRSALRDHGLTTRRRRLLADRLDIAPPSMSVLLMTRRARNVPFALAQIARQTWPDEMQIVLALHGVPASDPMVRAGLEFVDAGRVTTMEIGADTVFGAGLDAAVRACQGDLIAKWDDDDWYGPHHLVDLSLALDYSGADAVGARQLFIHQEELGSTDIRRVRAERFVDQVGGGSFCFRGETLRALGVRPLRRLVDLTLARRLLQAGGRFYATHGLGYCVRRHDHAHTWHPPEQTAVTTPMEERRNGFVLPPEIPASWEELRRSEPTSWAFG